MGTVLALCVPVDDGKESNNKFNKKSSNNKQVKEPEEWTGFANIDINNKSEDNKEDEEKTPDSGFDDNLFQMIVENNKDKNLIFSPLSILITMSIAMCGAQNETLKQMLNVLFPNNKNKELSFENISSITSQAIDICKYYNQMYNGHGNGDNKEDEVTVKIINKLWISKGYKILNEYIETTGIDYIESINTSNNTKVANLVNKWCADNTNNIIKEIISPKNINNETKILISNAMYFKGKFVRPFPKYHTRENQPFYCNNKRDEELCKVTMMSNPQTPQSCKHKVNDKYDFVKLRYKSSKLALVLVIDNYSNDQHDDIGYKLSDIFDGYDNRMRLDLSVPKFKYEYQTKLVDILDKMGITDAFNENADFSTMTGNRDLYINEVFHKTMIEVDELGTEAAAVTVIEGMSKSVAVTIKFDHPFDFFIVDQAKKITLFSGRYVGK